MEDNRFYVYEYFIKKTEEVFYVGKGTKDRYKVIKGRNKFFLDMYMSHECDVRIIMDGLDEETAFAEEYKRIQYIKETTDFRLTNQTDGGDGVRGFKPSPEHIEKCREAVIERWNNPEWKNKQVEIRRDPNGVFKSDTFRKKISALVKGNQNPNFGHKWTEEMKKKSSERMANRYVGKNNPNSKRILCVETNQLFETYTDAAKYLGLKSSSSISHAIESATKTAGGFHWKKI